MKPKVKIMKEEHYKKYFLKWHEEKLSEDEKTKLEEHLAGCSDCRNYFEKMNNALLPVKDLEIIELKPDPYLPQRVKSLSGENNGFIKYDLNLPSLKWTAIGFAFSFLLLIASFFSLNNGSISQQKSTNIYYDYYQSISQQSFSSNLDYLSNSLQETKK